MSPRDHALGLTGPARPPAAHAVNPHKLGSVIVTNSVASWKCDCGDSGFTSRAFGGEDLEAKARRNHAAHAKRRAAGVQRPR